LICEEAGFDPIIAQEVATDKQKQNFMLTQAQRYFVNNQSLFKEAIADTFFDRILAAVDMKMIDHVIQEVIDGTGHFAPVLVNPLNGAQIVHRGDQIWTRLKQANIIKTKEIKAAQENVERLQKKVRGIEMNIKAIEAAKSLTLDYVKELSLDELKEIVINEDGSRTEKKRIFQFVPSGDIAFYIAEQMDRGRRAGRNDIQKSEYKRAATFYQNCNINNTPKELNNRLMMMHTELPKVNEVLSAATQKLHATEMKRLDSFDDSLKKIRQAFVANIGKARL
ncbi:MAG: hypothetical protein LBN32_03845, partial [Helicobacteraceae bacterium]|nr:hypothetical protein [Helicobacteraceae bacterium]